MFAINHNNNNERNASINNNQYPIDIRHLLSYLTSIMRGLNIKRSLIENKLTNDPITGDHVGEVRNDVEGGIHDVSDGQVDDEVVGHRSHPCMGHHNPYH